VAGDWDGNGTVTVGVVDPASMTWYLRNTNGAGAPDVPPFRYGGSGWEPVVGDWDGDGRSTVGAVDRGGLWYLRFSNTAGPPDVARFPYGLGGWTPVAGNPDVSRLPLRAAGPALPGPGAALLTQQELEGVVRGALARLRGAGADPALLGRLSSARYVPAPLGGASLGLTDVASQVVRLDGAAAGYGWFVDPTPLRDEEFAVGRPGSPLAALPGPAAGKMDLLTAVLHEMSHLAGRPDLDAPGHADDLMADALSPGTRRTEALDTFFAGGL
jgi:hypothetical protein